MNPLPLLGNKLVRWVVGGLAGAVLLLAGWLYIDHLQHQNADLRAQAQAAIAARQQAEKTVLVLGDEMNAAKERAATHNEIKEKVRAAKSGTVPADIRAALDGLRNH